MDNAKRKRLIKAIGTRVYNERWYYYGTEFGTHDRYEVGGASIYARISVSGFAVKAYVEGEKYGMQDFVRMFVGGSAMQEAIEWTADRILQIGEEVKARTMPYMESYEQYRKALRGE